MRFQVPQFLEIKSKIFGPLTLQQFIYLAGGGGLSAIAWFLIPHTYVSVIIIIPIASFSLALAFYKVNEQPFIETLEAGFYWLVGKKLYIWKKQKPKDTPAEAATPKQVPISDPNATHGKLKDMTWNLDVNASTSVDEKGGGVAETGVTEQE